MPFVNSSDTKLNYVRETSVNVAGTTGWKRKDVNSIDTFGAEVEKTPRAPITSGGFRRKSKTTNITAGVEIGEDLTVDAALDVMGDITQAKIKNIEVIRMPVTSVDATTGFALATDLTSDQADLLKANTLLWGSHFTNNANNGLFVLTADTNASDSAVDVAGVVDESTGGYISLGGSRIPASVSKTLAWDPDAGKAGLLTMTVANADQIPGLYEGQQLHIGSPDSTGENSVNAFTLPANTGTNTTTATVANGGNGWVTIRKINSGSLVFGDVPEDLQFNVASNPNAVIDLVYGCFARDVEKSHADSEVVTRTFELQSPGQGDGTKGNTDDQFFYVIGCQLSSISVGVSQRGLITLTSNYVANDETDETSTQMTGADAAQDILSEDVFVSGDGFQKVEVEGLGLEEGLFVDSVTPTIDRGLSPRNVANKGAAIAKNQPVITVTCEITALLAGAGVKKAIRNDYDLGCALAFTSADGCVGFNIYSASGSGGGRAFPPDDFVTYTMNVEGNGDETFDETKTVGISVAVVPIPEKDC